MPDDIFNQGEVYFSKSQGQLVTIRDMPLPYARNVMAKLLVDHPVEFRHSELERALMDRLTPARQEIRDQLRLQGQAAIYVGHGARVSVSAARARMRRAGAEHTHIKGTFIEGYREASLHVKVVSH